MNQRDISEIKRRLNPDKRYPTVIRGCYVAADGHIISTFAQPVYALPQEENEKYMAIFRKTLSGTLGQNLLPVEFTALQTMEGPEHHLLMALRDSSLTDEDAVDAFWQKVISVILAGKSNALQSVNQQQAADNYLILLMHDGYDVPFKDGNDEIDRERSTDVFSYILCSVCTVKQSKPALMYFAAESEFHSREADWVVGAPEQGFLFPSFDDRQANVYGAMYYTKDAADPHDDFIEAVFNTPKITPAPQQTETFQNILRTSLQDECSLDVVQQVHETVSAMMEEHKADKSAEPLAFSAPAVREVLENCGVSPDKAAVFEEYYIDSFGDNARIPAVNLVAPRTFKVTTPSVSIKVDPENSHLLETRIIDGKQYILILADGDVEVNGVNVKL